MTIVYDSNIGPNHLFMYDGDETGVEFQALDSVALALRVSVTSRTAGVFIYHLDDNAILTNVPRPSPMPTIGRVIQMIQDRGFPVQNNHSPNFPRP